ncbi:hypothetical protein [Rugosimonospora acidiphila]
MPPTQEPGQQRKLSRRGLFGIIGGAVVVAGGGFFGARALAGGGSDDSDDFAPLPGAAANSGGISTDDVNALLGVLNTALTKRDKASFVSRHTPGAVATQAGRMFDNIGKFTFDKLEYQVIGQGGRLFNAGGGASSVKMDIALVHQVRGVDATPLPEWYEWTLSRSGTDAPVVITAVNGASSVLGEAKYVYYPAIWDSPKDIVVIERPNVVLTAETAADGDLLKKSADVIAQAIATNRTVWKQAGAPTTGLAPGAFIVGTSDRDKFYYWYSGEANQHGNEAALTIPVLNADSMDQDRTVTQVFGSRIVADLTTDFFHAGTGEETAQDLFQHEDTHNMTFSIMTASDPSMPLWVVEGFADFMATRSYSNPLQNYVKLPELKQYATVGDKGRKWDGKSFPSNDNVYSDDLVVADGCYGLGTMVFYFIEQKYGLDKAIGFAVANYRPAANANGSPGDDDPAKVASQLLGISLDDLRTQWVAFVHQVIGA